MIRIENLSKSYGKGVKVLDNIDLKIEEGKIYGFLGRNGAGKTTLINIITNRIFATSGNVYIDGENALENDAAQGKIFCMTEKGSYPEIMKVKDCLLWAKNFYPEFDEEYALKLCEELELNIKKRISQLSTGYGSILKLILSLASNAKILILDEPVLGLDAGMRDFFYKELIEVYNKNNSTIIISTHLIEEISNILENVILIKEGQIIANSTVEDILKRVYVITGSKENVLSFSKGKKVIDTRQIGDYMEVAIEDSYTTKEKTQVEKLGLTHSVPKLNEIFIKLTSKRGSSNE